MLWWQIPSCVPQADHPLFMWLLSLLKYLYSAPSSISFKVAFWWPKVLKWSFIFCVFCILGVPRWSSGKLVKLLKSISETVSFHRIGFSSFFGPCVICTPLWLSIGRHYWLILDQHVERWSDDTLTNRSAWLEGWPIVGRHTVKFRKWAYIFQRPFLRGLFLEGLIYGRKFAFQNR